MKSLKSIITIIVIFALLSGCATVSNKETYIACGAADVITTGIGIGTGTMVEANPITNALHIGALGDTLGTVVPIVGMLWLLYLVLDKIDEPNLTGGVAAVECGAAVYNLGFIL